MLDKTKRNREGSLWVPGIAIGIGAARGNYAIGIAIGVVALRFAVGARLSH